MAMFTDAQLASMRSTVTDTLSDTCTISQPGTDTFDSTTGYGHSTGQQILSGACRFGALDTSDRVVEVGGEPVSLRTYRLRLPWNTIGVKVDQVVVCTASNDPHLVNRRFRVVDVRGMTDPLGRSVIVEEVLG